MISKQPTLPARDPLFRACRLALIAALSAGLSLSVAAQEGAGETAPDVEENEGVDLDALQVTARRRQEALRDVPISVTAFSGDELQDIGAQDITYLKQAVPNTTIEVSRGTSTTLTSFIRGVGQQDPVSGFEAGVGVYIDDVYLNRPQGAVLDVYDVERIEVLRGPQGTLYGRNTIGGAVKYVTRRLGREPAGSVRGSLGSFSQRDIKLSGETPIGDSLAIGATVASFNRDGFGRNLETGLENYNKDLLAFRASAEWMPTTDTFVRLAVDYLDDDSNPVGGHRLVPGLVSGAPVLDNVFDSRGGMQGANNTEQTGVSLLIEHDISPAWLFKSISAWREDDSIQQLDFDALPARDVDVEAAYVNDQFSQEFQLHYNSDLINGVAGFYYLDASSRTVFDVVLGLTGDLIGAPGLNGFSDADFDTESWSLFTDVSLDLGRWLEMDTGLELSLGGRYTSDKRDGSVLRQTLVGGSSPFFGGSAVPIATTSDFEGSETFTDFSPRLSLAWQPTGDHNLYVSYSQGFKGGGFDPRGATTAALDLDGDGVISDDEIFEVMRFKPEEVDSWEIGAKSQFFDGRVNTNLAFFYSDYSDIQVPGSIGVDSTGDGVNDTFAGVTTNAGAATVKGVELEIDALLGRHLMRDGDALAANVALGYINASYDEFITLAPSPVTGQLELRDVSDERVFQNTPRTTGHARLRYSMPLELIGNGGQFSVIAALSGRSRTNQFESSNPFLDQPGYGLVDLNLVWRSNDGRYDLGLHGRNLTDREYIVSGWTFITPDGSTSTLGLEGVATAFYGAPRTISATFGINF